ncbi:MAG: GAF domain-containing protein [Terriglobales bacterium]
MSAASVNVGPWRAHTLQPIAARAMKITGADGVAIALAAEGHIVCQASAGHAPQVGSRIDMSSRWSVRCMRERQPVSFSHSLERGSYSGVLVPLLRDGKAIGFFAAFATRAEAFNPRHVRVLMKIAETTVRNLAPEPRAETLPAKQAAEVSQSTAKVSSEQLDEIEREIAAFAIAEHRRARVTIATKATIGALAVILASACIFPDQVQRLSSPIAYRINRSFQSLKTPQNDAVHSVESASAAPGYAGRR